MTRSADAEEAPPQLARRRQIRAADPSQSTWVFANAGSGKTSVLTDRVSRLLLSGTEPQRILCLTYTIAAASQMQSRLFGRLGSWAMLPEPELRKALAELGVTEAIGPEMLARARRLFASAIETPGGLKIQTIHAFCASLLRRFPVESGISPDFVELDDRAGALLRGEVLQSLAEGSGAAEFEALASHLSDEGLTDILAGIGKYRDALMEPPDPEGMRSFLGGRAKDDAAALMRDLDPAATGALLARLVPILRLGGNKDIVAADELSALLDRPLSIADLGLLEGRFLTGKGAAAPHSAKIGAFPSKDLRKGPAAELMDDLDDLMLRVEDLRQRRLALATSERSLALHRFGRLFLQEMDRRKALRGYLDFDDLIRRAILLLSNASVAQWVLFRLDGGIDHILIDEAQDTSPAQWQVILRLLEEFTAGTGARDVARTLFVVGDLKQSIYSFQGADLGAFNRVRSDLDRRFREAGLPVQEVALEHSFRSSQAILDLVDHTFTQEHERGLGGQPVHRAFHGDLPGRVDLWTPEPRVEAAQEQPWYDPVDRRSPEDGEVRLARKIATELRAMIDSGTTIPGRNGPKVLAEGDILVLLMRRKRLFYEIIRACKAAGLRVAGADRLVLTDETAVRDLLSLLRFLSLPEDDLALAECLRSPLFGVTEAQLFDLAHRRPEGSRLWNALYRHREEFGSTVEILTDLRAAADFLRPFELLDRALTRHGGRKRLVARLGPEAEDGIDALLAEALDFERTEVPGLLGFLARMEHDEIEIKRQSESGSGAIRVMTVHGAKGLEAPMVILPETALADRSRQVPLHVIDGRVVWAPPQDLQTRALAEALADMKEVARDERMRLLYVALTRAETWLIVCAPKSEVSTSGSGPPTWFDLVSAGMISAGARGRDAEGRPWPFGDGLRLEHGAWPAPLSGATVAIPPSVDGDPRLGDPLAPVPRAEPVLSATGLGGAKALAGDHDAQAPSGIAFGTALHLLLERLPGLPQVQWDEAAPCLLAGLAVDLPAEVSRRVMETALRLLRDPALAWLLTRPDRLVEVTIAGPIGAGGPVLRGVIDLLLIESDRVLAIDYKSNVIVPGQPEDVPEGILRQMGAYAALLAGIYPGRRIETAILWTADATLMPLPAHLVAQALSAAAP